MNQFVLFLSKLGFTNPRQTTRKDIIELVVHDTLKESRKLLRGHRLQFMCINSERTRNSVVQEFYAIQDRVTVGRIRLEAFATHSVIHLTNLGD